MTKARLVQSLNNSAQVISESDIPNSAGTFPEPENARSRSEPPRAYLGLSTPWSGCKLCFLPEGSLKDTFCPFGTWRFPPKSRESAIYKLQCSGVCHVSGSLFPSINIFIRPKKGPSFGFMWNQVCYPQGAMSSSQLQLFKTPYIGQPPFWFH